MMRKKLKRDESPPSDPSFSWMKGEEVTELFNELYGNFLQDIIMDKVVPDREVMAFTDILAETVYENMDMINQKVIEIWEKYLHRLTPAQIYCILGALLAYTIQNNSKIVERRGGDRKRFISITMISFIKNTLSGLAGGLLGERHKKKNN